MELQEIEVEIGKDGKVQLHVRGVNGQACIELTKELEDALGGEVLERIMTPDASQPPTVQITPRQDIRRK